LNEEEEDEDEEALELFTGVSALALAPSNARTALKEALPRKKKKKKKKKRKRKVVIRTALSPANIVFFFFLRVCSHLFLWRSAVGQKRSRGLSYAQNVGFHILRALISPTKETQLRSALSLSSIDTKRIVLDCISEQSYCSSSFSFKDITLKLSLLFKE